VPMPRRWDRNTGKAVWRVAKIRRTPTIPA
jgi:hypothetical protein